MIDFEDFKKTINLIEQNKVQYWVFGGFALEGIRGEITRDHEDIDMYIHSEDLDKFLGLFPKSEYKSSRREQMYFIESPKLKIGVVILTQEGDLLVANGNKTLAKYPKEIFSKELKGSIKNFTFRVVPKEILAIESKFSRYEFDKFYAEKLDYKKEMLDKIQIIKIRDSKDKQK